jgi:putative transposase
MLILSENVWNEIKNVIPARKSNIGRPAKDPRIILSAIFYVMVTGVQWHKLPYYYGRPTTIHGKFRLWIKSGVFYNILSKSIGVALKQFGFPECFLSDTSSVKAPFAKFGGKNPTDRAKNGVKKGLVIDWNRVILSVLIDAANKHDSRLLMPHIPYISKFLDKPKVMSTDSAWDVKKLRKDLAKVNLALHAATNVRRNKSKKKIKPKGRWKIEQVFGIQQWNRGIKVCWTKTKESFLALCQFASAIHNFRLVGILG